MSRESLPLRCGRPLWMHPNQYFTKMWYYLWTKTFKQHCSTAVGNQNFTILFGKCKKGCEIFTYRDKIFLQINIFQNIAFFPTLDVYQISVLFVFVIFRLLL